MKPEAVLFDCDGVLVDSEPATFALIQSDVAAHGRDMSIPELEHLLMGGTVEGIPQIMREMGANLPPDWSETFYDRLNARLGEGTALMPGVTALLARLDAEGVKYAVGSNGRTSKMHTTLGQHPEVWAKLKDKLFSGREIGHPKPAPDVYLTAAKALGADPARCVVVEDSAPGARAGVAAGMRVFGYAPHGATPALVATGAVIFADMADLPGLIGL